LEDLLSRAQHAYEQAKNLRHLAELDQQPSAKEQLLALAASYDHIYENLLRRYSAEKHDLLRWPPKKHS
jgi:pyruvate-formate lyase